MIHNTIIIHAKGKGEFIVRFLPLLPPIVFCNTNIIFSTLLTLWYQHSSHFWNKKGNEMHAYMKNKKNVEGSGDLGGSVD